MATCDKGHVRIEWEVAPNGPCSLGVHICPVCMRERELRLASKMVAQLNARIESLELAAKRKKRKPPVKRIRARRGYTRTVTQIGVADGD